VSRYILLGLVARGGFGAVYSAYDPELDRKVAVKLLHGGVKLADEEARTRLVREARALARFSHPNVVTVHDVGTFEAGEIVTPESSAATDHPLEGPGVFIVMELVEGMPLRDWMKSPRPWREVVQVFSGAGRGLAAAHAKQLVHRDFKPGNVILGDDGVVKVLDFGLARLLGAEEEPRAVESPTVEDPVPEASLDTPLTMTGTVMGTPRYMAPEQHAGGSTDAAADQFAFAAAMFEALHGVPAFKGRGERELAGAKAEGRVAAPPASTQVPAGLNRLLVKALAPDPEGRFASMGDLLAGIQAVQHRRRRMVVGSVVVLGSAFAVWLGAMLAGGTPICEPARDQLEGVWDEGTKSAVRAAFMAKTDSYAADTWAAVERELDRYTGAWAAQWDAACASTPASEQRSARQGQLFCLERSLRRVGGLTQLFAEADGGSVQHAMEATAQLPSLASCDPGDMAPARYGEGPAKEATLAVESKVAYADSLSLAGDLTRAVATAKEAAALAEQGGVHPATLADAQVILARAHREAGHYDEAREAAEAALHAAESAGEQAPAMRAMIVLVRILTDLGRHDEADLVAELAQAKLEAMKGRHDLEAELLYNVGLLRTDQERYPEAIESLRRGLALRIEQLGPDHPIVARFHNTLGNAHEDATEYEPALREFGRAREIWRAFAGDSHPSLAYVTNNIANVLVGQGEHERAWETYEEALRIAEAEFPKDHPGIALVLGNQAWLLGIMDRPADALHYYDRVIGIRTRALGPEHPGVAGGIHGRGWARFALGRCEKALADFERGLALRTKRFGVKHGLVAASLSSIAAALECLDHREEALEHSDRALNLRQEMYGKEDRRTTYSLLNNAKILDRLGRHADALEMAEAALAIRVREFGEDDGQTAWARIAKGRALNGLGRTDEALAALRRSIDTFEEPYAADVAEALLELARAETAAGDRAAAIAHLERAAKLADLGPHSNPRIVARIAAERAKLGSAR
jgi:serine/threonine-protein kinase